MLIYVFSDTHGDTCRMDEILKKGSPDICVHLGDFTLDAENSFARAGISEYYIIRGNCDVDDRFQLMQTINIEGHKFFITHGHKYWVKLNLSKLASEAMKNGAEAAFFGHTHQSASREINGVRLFNPGSLSVPRGFPPSYGVITIDGDKVLYEIKRV